MHKQILSLATLLMCCGAFADEQIAAWGGGLQGTTDSSLPWGKTKPKEEEEAEAPKDKKEVPPNNNQIRIGAAYSYLWLDRNPTQQGSLWGAQGIYEYRPQSGIYEGIKADYRQGTVTRGNDIYKTDILSLRGEERVGFSMHHGSYKLETTFFTGFGYRFLQEADQINPTGPFSRDYNEFYVPVGFLADRHIYKEWRGGINFVWMPQVFTFVDVVATPDVDHRTNRRLGNFLVEAPVTYTTGHWVVEFKPFFEYWQNGAASTLALAEDNYIFVGIELNAGYSF
jgi:hypothetical protein